MRCQQCGIENAPDAQWCRQCGAPLQAHQPPANPVCAVCGTPARTGARFCSRCGTPFAAPGTAFPSGATTPGMAPHGTASPSEAATPGTSPQGAATPSGAATPGTASQSWQPTVPAPQVPLPPYAPYSHPPAAGAPPTPKTANRTWFWIAVPVVGLAIVAVLGWQVFTHLAPLFRPDATPIETVQQQPGETLPTTELPTEAPATATPTTEAPLQTTQAPAATAALTPTTAAAPCPPDAKYVADLTILDNEKLAPGAAFTKSWRVRSTGCAAWSSGTELVFVDGERLEAPASVAVPATAPESTADISVDMRAPTAPGTYRSTWQLRGPDGSFFGGRIYVQIVVPGPLTISFAADRTTLKQGQCATLSWQVENAVSILLNGKEIAAEGSSVECPPATTGFELTAKDIQGNWKRSTLIITVETGY